jgi:hypothetical protein
MRALIKVWVKPVAAMLVAFRNFAIREPVLSWTALLLRFFDDASWAADSTRDFSPSSELTAAPAW